VRWYGTQGDTTQSHRRIKKPIGGTEKVAIAGLPVDTNWSADSTTGVVTFTDVTYPITGITLGATTVVDVVAHTYSVGDTVAFSGIVGTTELNGLRGVVSAMTLDTITVAIDSALFTPYDSGGATHSAPLESETVTAGCYFDLPVHFVEPLNGSYNNANVVSGSLMIEELLNP
jgi:hypothetical protein